MMHSTPFSINYPSSEQKASSDRTQHSLTSVLLWAHYHMGYVNGSGLWKPEPTPQHQWRPDQHRVHLHTYTPSMKLHHSWQLRPCLIESRSERRGNFFCYHCGWHASHADMFNSEIQKKCASGCIVLLLFTVLIRHFSVPFPQRLITL